MGNHPIPVSEEWLETSFAGEFAHALDEKGRLAIPAKFRPRFKEGAVVTRWLDECLAVFPSGEWGQINAEIRRRPRTDRARQSFVHFAVAGAHEAEPDGQGRISVPAHLRDYAGLSGETLVIGAADHLELWQPERWRARLEHVESTIGESIADLGI
ncbi:MAG TPA: division/cell wall cluster transcriptional repressor MraZ [Candidatus Limnocylindria bacterium]